MRILLLGDYSNVHATLAQGLRALGHDVVVASDGDGWKDYPRNIDLRRYDLGAGGTISFLSRLLRAFPKFRGFDVVQLINPMFLPLRAERMMPFYRYLRHYNRRVFLGAFGMDHYWVKTAMDCRTFRYSDFNIGSQLRQRADNDLWIRDWLHGSKGDINRLMADDCDGIVAGLYEYYVSYRHDHGQKLTFIPFPIDVQGAELRHGYDCESFPIDRPVRIFIGVQRARSSYKGTDVMLCAMERLRAERPQDLIPVVVEDVPFDEYRRLMLGSEVILDQLYAYTPAMNALQAMAQGLIVVGGGEPEHYGLLGCTDLRPILNVEPTEESVYRVLTHLLDHRTDIPRLAHESRVYALRYHDHVKVAQQYLDYWQRVSPRHTC